MKYKLPKQTDATTPTTAILVAKAFDPVGGVCLKYETNRAAEVGRLILGFQELGQLMQNVPPTVKRKASSGEEMKGEPMAVVSLSRRPRHLWLQRQIRQAEGRRRKRGSDSLITLYIQYNPRMCLPTSIEYSTTRIEHMLRMTCIGDRLLAFSATFEFPPESLCTNNLSHISLANFHFRPILHLPLLLPAFHHRPSVYVSQPFQL